uniref:Uncharacterized protein n=1 Tax=Anguilla anguilla TaxID=7936 RepID=A0A0E9W9E3_ANGAN
MPDALLTVLRAKLAAFFVQQKQVGYISNLHFQFVSNVTQ